ncbi:MAG: GNAT family N-acetyltransferase [Flavobacterium sp.]|nr:MAG: GNAT family N-acetyltransferase [Flavobacterium sp.]
MEFIIVNANTSEDTIFTNRKIAEFLVTHLEQYGDKIEDIEKSMDYAMDASKGGTILAGIENGKIIGAVVLNRTGMQGYIPENILVYIAVDSSQRGKGYGKTMMNKALSLTEGSIALHVEPDNPALHLYEKLGFTNKYLEMRLTR